MASRSKRGKKAKRGTSPPQRPFGQDAKSGTQRAELGKKRAYEARDNGLRYLLQFKKISPQDYWLGERYGRAYRIADLGETPSIKSCLAEPERTGGGGPVGPPGLADVELVAWAKADLTLARDILGFESGLVGVCDLICGQQLRPREIDPRQRVAEEIATTLSNALQLLAAKGWGRVPIPAQ